MHGGGRFDNKSNMWEIYLSDEELPIYEPLFRKFVPNNYKTRIHYTGTKGNIWAIEGPAPEFEFDVADRQSQDLYVPEIVFKASIEEVRAYLQGLFQANGWFTDVIGLTSVSCQLIEDVALLLSYIGVDSTIRKK